MACLNAVKCIPAVSKCSLPQNVDIATNIWIALHDPEKVNLHNLMRYLVFFFIFLLYINAGNLTVFRVLTTKLMYLAGASKVVVLYLFFLLLHLMLRDLNACSQWLNQQMIYGPVMDMIWGLIILESLEHFLI